MTQRTKPTPAEDDAVEIVTPGSSLGDKVTVEAGASPETMFEAADAAIEVQAAGYLERIRADLAEARSAIDLALGSKEMRSAAVDRAFVVTHNMKGQGETFGYPLVTQICSLVCGIMQRAPRPDETKLRAIKAHLEALEIVIHHNLSGDGGALGEQLVDRLQGLAEAASR